jgi:hypothetical protein
MTEESKPSASPARTWRCSRSCLEDLQPSHAPLLWGVAHLGSRAPLRSYRTIAPGTLSYSAGGALRISVEAEHYRIEAEDLKQLLFYGRVVPIIGERSRATADGIAIEGHAAMNASGKAVMLHTRAGSYIIPLVSFQRVARGEAISAPLFPLIPEAGRC